MTVQAYVGLGGNIGDTVKHFDEALDEIAEIPRVFDLKCSNYYQTTPVGPLDQNDYLNAVCTFKTSLSVKELHQELRKIESKLGKVPKAKYHPRVIDLDLLLFGLERLADEELCVPHPSWDDRLFVLAPLSELVEELTIPCEEGRRKVVVKELLQHFPNRHNESVKVIAKPSYEKVCV